MKRPFSILASSVILGLVASIGAVSTASADVGPVRRISCPSIAEINKLDPDFGGPRLGRLDASLDACLYYEEGDTEEDGYTLGVILVDDASTPQQYQDMVRASYPKDYGYPFTPEALPALGEGAWGWADIGPYELAWQLSPGVVASMYGAWGNGAASLVPLAELFRPMMEVYTIPGERTVNGRQWRTTCEGYSRTARCRTEIKATVVRKTATGYAKVHDWAFNSLTYRWSDRALWGSNPLGYTNNGWTSAEGRQWKTECDTARTGRGACRSYLLTTVIDFKGGRYTSENKWVFNNQVLFTN